MSDEEDGYAKALAKLERHLSKIRDAADATDLQEARHLSDRYEAARSERTTRLRAWTLAANSGGLLLLLNGMMSGQLGATPGVNQLVWYFLGGLACVFLSELADRNVYEHLRSCADRMIGLFADSQRLAAMGERLKRDPTDPDTDKLLASMMTLAASLDERIAARPDDRTFKTWSRIAVGLEGLGISTFAVGVALAIMSPSFLTSTAAVP